jgi:hypothetical protein
VSGYRLLKQPAAPVRRPVRARHRETAHSDLSLIENAGTLLIGVVAAVMVWAFIKGPLEAPDRARLAGAHGAYTTGQSIQPWTQPGTKPGAQPGLQPGTLSAALLDDDGASLPAIKRAPLQAQPGVPGARTVVDAAAAGTLPRPKALADSPPVRLAKAPLPEELTAVPPPNVSAVTFEDIASASAPRDTEKAVPKAAHRRAKAVRSLYRAAAKPDPQMTKYGRRFPRWARQMYETPWSPWQSNPSSSGK